MRVSLDFGVLAFQRQTGFEPAQYTVFMRVSEGYYQQIINFFKKQQKKGTGITRCPKKKGYRKMIVS